MTELWDSVVLLEDISQIAGFCCARESVQNWLENKALSSRQFVSTRLYLDSAGQVIGFTATTSIVVVVEDGSSSQRAGSRDGLSVGYLLAQMGVRQDLEGQGIGKALVRECMRSAASAHAEAPFPLFVVDAADEGLTKYYESMGLRKLDGTLRLVAPMKSILKSL